MSRREASRSIGPSEPPGTAGSLVLVVDDEPSICWAFRKMLEAEGHRVLTASSAEDGLQLAAADPPDLVLLDVRLPNEDGISALPKFLEATNQRPIIVMTAFGDLETAVAAIRRGASDYLIKPFRLEDALQACRKVLRYPGALLSSPSSGAGERPDEGALIGTSPAMQQVFRQIAMVAPSDLPVLITGETGTGKELVAAAIHQHSLRADQPYLPIAPVALHPELIESELFGHVKGAFTGAIEERAGLFERAAGGTVLLDEIGDLPLAIQVKLLRVLDQGEYFRVGDVRPRRSDVRILAATNADLHQEVRAGRFREDLFYRLSGLHIRLSPLTDRPADIEPLCQHFLRLLGHPAAGKPLEPSLLADLKARRWPGNVRELRHAVEHAAVIARGRPLTGGDFPPPRGDTGDATSDAMEVERLVAEWARRALADSDSPTDLHAKFLRAFEPALLRIVLQSTGGNRAKAAERLGIHRATLRDRLREYGLDAEA